MKERFRPPQTALDQEIEQALDGVSLDQLYSANKAPGEAAGTGTGEAEGKGARRGRVISIGNDDVIVDLGEKSQGMAPLSQFLEEGEPVKIGDEFEFVVDRFDQREGMLVLSRKGAVATRVTWENLEVGQIVEGNVTGMNKGGLELNIKTMRAFMPAGQVGLYFEKDLSVHLGERMTVEVVQCDRERKNLIVSRRHILEREKQEQRQKTLAEIAEGQVRQGTIRNIMDFGAFVDLGGVDGLVHVSEMSFRRGVKPSDLVKVGDRVDVKVLKIDADSGKISLSLKQALGTDPWQDAATKYAVGTAVTGRITRVEGFGAFVEVEEGLEGLLPISEMSYQRIRTPNEVVKEGDTVRMVVINVDPPQRRMSFSLKQAGPDPWKDVQDRYARDMVTSGTVTRVVDFGAFVELQPGLEGLVHISELADQRVRAAADVVKPGQAVQVRVLEIDAEGRRISLSIRRAAAPPATSTSAASTQAPAKPDKKREKRREQLRGGLDF
jgi:small subunit ribosomal protein S1